MKKAIVGIVSLAASAGAFGAAIATPAQGVQVHQYIHGSARMASFSTWNQCQRYATWSVNTVRSHGGQLTPGMGDNGSRTTCFPVSNGRWTYLTVYTATKPITAGDFDERATDSSFGDSIWAANHHVAGPMNTFTAAKCAAANVTFQRRIASGASTRLLPSLGCQLDSPAKQRQLDVTYLMSAKSSAVSGDTATVWRGSLLQEAWTLGYRTQAD